MSVVVDVLTFPPAQQDQTLSISSTASASGQSPQQVNAGRYTHAINDYRAKRGGRADQS